MEGVIVHDKINRKYAINFVLLKLCFRESRLWIWLNKSRYKPHAIGLWVIIKYIILKIYSINAKIDENAGHHAAHIDMFDSRILGGNLKSIFSKTKLQMNKIYSIFSSYFVQSPPLGCIINIGTSCILSHIRIKWYSNVRWWAIGYSISLAPALSCQDCAK